MDMMRLLRRKPQVKLATVCRNGLAAVVHLERTEKRNLRRRRRRRRRSRRAGRLRHKYMHSKISRKELKVNDRVTNVISQYIHRPSF